jgi:hypothetical protein
MDMIQFHKAFNPACDEIKNPPQPLVAADENEISLCRTLTI